MDKQQFLQYAELISKANPFMNIAVIEKDYVLSLFLSKYESNKAELPSLQKIIFKGGTLLAKKYLKYHRISVDLDFTHIESNQLRKEKPNSREKKIKQLIIPILEEIKKIADSCGFDFMPDRKNEKYIKILNDRSVYKIYVYYTSFVTGTDEQIKIEINFIEEKQFPHNTTTLTNLSEHLHLDKKLLVSTGYDLIPANLLVYDIEEIMLEKIRAILTRNALKERDILDLYLLDKQFPLNKINILQIKKKVISAEGFIQRVDKHLDKSIKILLENPQDFLKSDDNIDVLLLIKINKPDYHKFKEELLPLLQKIIIDIQQKN